MDMSKREGKNLMKKWWFWALVVVFVIGGFYMSFQDNIKAHKLGIDVEYLKDPLYCQVDSDCVKQNNCGSVNKYNYKKTNVGCDMDICDISCVSNKCNFNTNCGG